MTSFFTRLANLPQKLRRITTSASYRPEIDGLRFFAITLVLVGHLTERIGRAQAHVAPLSDAAEKVFGLARPGIGVFLFFTISGFILASQFLKRPTHVLHSSFLKPYFLRRLTRIEPPYFILLLATFAFLSLTGYSPSDVNSFDKKPDSLSVSLVASLLYSHGWWFGSFPRLFPPGWSLEIEVQFYLLAPLLFFIYFRIPGIRKRIFYGIVITLITSIFEPIIDAMAGARGNLYFTIVDHFHQFWIGIVLADASKHLNAWIDRCPPRLASIGGWLGVAVLAGTAAIPVHPAIGLIIVNLISLVAICFMFLGALKNSGFKRFCSRPWISLLGGACYSIYLIHLQSMQVLTQLLYRVLHLQSALFGLLLNLLIQLPLVYAIGLVFYWMIERPFMQPDWPSRVGRLFTQRRPVQEAPVDEA